MGRDGNVTEHLAEEMGDALGHPPRVDEHECRAMRAHMLGDDLDRAGKLLVRGDRTQLVVSELDLDVESTPMAGVDDGAAWSAIGGAAIRAGPD